MGEGDGPAEQPGRVAPRFTRGDTRLTWLPDGGGQVDLSTVVLSVEEADGLALSAIQRIAETFAGPTIEGRMGPSLWDSPDANPLADMRAMAELYRQHNQAPVSHLRASAELVRNYASPTVRQTVEELRRAAGVPEQPGDIVVFDWGSAQPVEYVAMCDPAFLDGLTTPPEESYVDQLAHDLLPDGCWATELIPPEVVYVDGMGNPWPEALQARSDLANWVTNPSPDAEACDRPAVDELGLCAEHRRRMVDEAD